MKYYTLYTVKFVQYIVENGIVLYYRHDYGRHEHWQPYDGILEWEDTDTAIATSIKSLTEDQLFLLLL
jgi:hypothetical protein